MAAEVSTGQQRSFVKNIGRQSAQQIREGAMATMKAMAAMKAMAEQQSRIKLRVVKPLDYEGELSSRKKELSKEQFLGLMLFPQQDVEVVEESWVYRTEQCTVPQNVLELAQSLFASECLKFYLSKWHSVVYKCSKYSKGYKTLIRPDSYQKLVADTFEMDVPDDEQPAAVSSTNYLELGAPLTKKGYLFKGPFPSEGGISVSMKNYRKRWFVLTGGSSDGGYFLHFYKDEKSSNLKGRIALDTCTEVKPNNRYKSHGFDVLTDNEKVFYPLAADNSQEMVGWIKVLNRAIGAEIDATDAAVLPISTYYQQDTLKDLKKTEIKPEYLTMSKLIEGKLSAKREEDSKPLFSVYPELLHPPPVSLEPKPHIPVPNQRLGMRFSVHVKNFQLRLMADAKGTSNPIEPFFITLALFDARHMTKLSEDFHVDINPASFHDMLPSPRGAVRSGPHPFSKHANNTTQAIFSVTLPHQDVYLVARIDKIIQGGIAACTEPYVKGTDTHKVSQKIVQQVPVLCHRLGAYHMPFAWAVRPVFQSEGNGLDLAAVFSPLHRQERERLADEDLLKILSEFKNLHKQKLQIIPGSIVVEISSLPLLGRVVTLTPSLLPVKSEGRGREGSVGTGNDSGGQISSPGALALEIQEFRGEFHVPYMDPHLSFINHLYVYPLSLKYDSQKQFAKARNVACCVQLKDSSGSLPNIYSTSPGTVFCDVAYTTVLHHCQNPQFYTEIKINLPVHLSPSHHLLFTFYHISCDITKSTKSKGSALPPIPESIVGYAWLPLMDANHRLLRDTHSLSVAANLPSDYLNYSKRSVGEVMKWVDSGKQLFRVSTKLHSTIYSQNPILQEFFSLCEQVERKGEHLDKQLEDTLQQTATLSLGVTIQFLPVLLTQLFRLLSTQDMEQLKAEVVRTLVCLVDTIVEAEREELLMSYIQHIFVTEVDYSKTKAVHDELARLLVLYFRMDQSKSEKLLIHLWFFLDIMLKSMAQFLKVTHKMQSSRKHRYLDDFGWNLQSLVAVLLEVIREKHTDPSVRKANRNLASFVKHCFNFMDRGVVFKMVTRYLEAFSYKENINLSEMKLEFLTIVCNHEHFIPLNLPFSVSPAEVHFSLSDEFCQRHFLAGVLLRELESALQYEVGVVRKHTIQVVRDLFAKHDSDSRYCCDAEQMKRIATLYFPLIPLVMQHVTRLNPGSTPYISPMLGAASMHRIQKKGAEPEIGSAPPTQALYQSNSIPPNPSLTSSFAPPSFLDKESSVSSSMKSRTSLTTSELAAAISHRRNPSISFSITGAPTLPTIDDERVPESLDASLTSESALAAQPTLVEVMMEMDRLSVAETRDLLVSVLFVLKHVDRAVLLHLWGEFLGNRSSHPLLGLYEDPNPGQLGRLSDFFSLLDTSLYTFKYAGRVAVGMKFVLQPRDTESRTSSPSPSPPLKERTSRKLSSSIVAGSRGKKSNRSSTISSASPSAAFPSPTISRPQPLPTPEELDLHAKLEGALANRSTLIVLSLMDTFMNGFQDILKQGDGDNYIMAKFLIIQVTLLQVSTSLTLRKHVFSFLRVFIHKLQECIFKGSSQYCGILCYEILRCCNSHIPLTRSEACSTFFLLMKYNNEFFKHHGFVRTNVQSTIAVSRLVSSLLGKSDANLRRSLTTVSKFVNDGIKFTGSAFADEVTDLMKRLKNVLNVTSQMKVHQNDPEKLMDLHYSLAKSYSSSPELRQTWLDSMAALHLKEGNYSEAAHCCLHIAGLVAECLKIQKEYPEGCAAFRHISPNIELEESGIREDKGAHGMDDRRYNDQNLISLLEVSVSYLEQAERYEVMPEVAKLLQPFYEKNRDSKSMMEMFGKLHQAFRKVVEIEVTGKRYLGTYFRVAFFGKPFGDDHEKQYIYKEPVVTALAEIVLRLQKLYSKKFGMQVNIIGETGKVDVRSLDLEKAHIQISHVEPFFAEETLKERVSRFERDNKLSHFVFETPFTREKKQESDVSRHCMRKTVLTTSHWFPFITKRIPVIHQEQFELCPIEVAIEAMEKKTQDIQHQVQRSSPDLKRLQLLLGGCISTQVNQGVQEYSVFLSPPHIANQRKEHLQKLKEAYRSFLKVCQQALDLNERLIATDQLLYHKDMKMKYEQMLILLNPLLEEGEETLEVKSPAPLCWSPSGLDPHRMSAILFHSISGNK